jgi:hypothetical protein
MVCGLTCFLPCVLSLIRSYFSISYWICITYEHKSFTAYITSQHSMADVVIIFHSYGLRSCSIHKKASSAGRWKIIGRGVQAGHFGASTPFRKGSLMMRVHKSGLTFACSGEGHGRRQVAKCNTPKVFHDRSSIMISSPPLLFVQGSEHHITGLSTSLSEDQRIHILLTHTRHPAIRKTPALFVRLIFDESTPARIQPCRKICRVAALARLRHSVPREQSTPLSTN